MGAVCGSRACVEDDGGGCDGVTMIISMLVDLCCAFVPVEFSRGSVLWFRSGKGFRGVLLFVGQFDSDCRERGLRL